VLDIIVQGNADKTCRLFASTNLLNWYPLATNQIGAGGSILFHDYCAPGTRACFYRVVMP
jgi:hypothetical protein